MKAHLVSTSLRVLCHLRISYDDTSTWRVSLVWWPLSWDIVTGHIRKAYMATMYYVLCSTLKQASPSKKKEVPFLWSLVSHDHNKVEQALIHVGVNDKISLSIIALITLNKVMSVTNTNISFHISIIPTFIIMNLNNGLKSLEGMSL